MKKVFIDGIRGCNPLVPYLPSSLFKGDLISYSSDYDILLKENLASNIAQAGKMMEKDKVLIAKTKQTIVHKPANGTSAIKNPSPVIHPR